MKHKKCCEVKNGSLFRMCSVALEECPGKIKIRINREIAKAAGIERDFFFCFC